MAVVLAGCKPYKVVDYPSAVDELPSEVWLDWANAKSQMGRESEAEWLAQGSDARRRRHARLKHALTDAYASELANQLPEGTTVFWGEAPEDALRLDLSLRRWAEGDDELLDEPDGDDAVHTMVKLQVDFVRAGQKMESVEIECLVSLPWIEDSDTRFERCGTQLGEAMGEYFKDRAGG